MEDVFIEVDGEIEATAPFIVHCGCGSVAGHIERAITLLGKNSMQFPKPNKHDRRVNKWLSDNEMFMRCPVLRNSTVAVLINPLTLEFLDLTSGNFTAERLKEVYDGSK